MDPCRARAASIGAAVTLLGALAGCAREDASKPAVDNTKAAVDAPDPYEDSPSRFGTVPLHAGFNPDPRVASGNAFGEVEAKTIDQKCRGWISQTPDYLLDADTAFLRLYILARSASDVTLVVRKPDGAVLCNDNRHRTKDPMIHSSFPIGTTQIWIGVKEQGATVPYRLGFSEVKWKSSSIPLPEAD